MKLLNTASGLLKAKFLGQPFYARFHVTHRCNHRCRMCALHELADESRELGMDEIRTVAARLWTLGARHAVITGGEAFLRRDIVEVVAAFAEPGFSVRIQTNGGPHVTRKLLQDCAAAGLRDISVSIDTLDKARQDDICRAGNVVDNAIRCLRTAREVLPDGISQANIVASRCNFAELPSLVRFFHSLGVYTYITPVMISTGMERLEHGDGDGDGETGAAGGIRPSGGDEYLFRGADRNFVLEGLDPALRDRVIDDLVSLRRDGMGLTNSTRYLEDFRRYLATGRCDWRCECGTMVLDVHPDGSVCPCKEKAPVGNILDEGFVDFYRSREFKRLAAETARRCSGCFYGEYREPQYAVRDISVFAEWVAGWFRTFRRGMRLGSRPRPLPDPPGKRRRSEEEPCEDVAGSRRG